MKDKTYLQIIALFTIIAVIVSFCAGCSTPLAKIAKIVEAAGTAEKDIDIMFSGMGGHGEYHSKRRFANEFPTNSTPDTGSSVIVTQPALRVQKVK